MQTIPNVQGTTVKPAFLQILNESGLNFARDANILAELAKVELWVVENMALHIPVPTDGAIAVLTIVSQHAGKIYTTDNVDILVFAKEEKLPYH